MRERGEREREREKSVNSVDFSNIIIYLSFNLLCSVGVFQGVISVFETEARRTVRVR